jgi:hypothetical protein
MLEEVFFFTSLPRTGGDTELERRDCLMLSRCGPVFLIIKHANIDKFVEKFSADRTNYFG